MESGVTVVKVDDRVVNLSQQDLALDAIQKYLVLYRYARYFSRKTQCEGVRGRELAMLRHLFDAGPLTVGQLCDYLFISNSATSELVSRMEDAGYVARRRSKQDSRVVFVELTAAGRQIAEETPLGGIPLLRERIKALSQDKLQRINGAFDDLIQIMEIDPDEFQ
ncbi:MAG: MarR family transcriptional regulator [Anaerolineae bacterium]|nr:MarR family transcriptional regulator [Anaerolineae bacterium]